MEIKMKTIFCCIVISLFVISACTNQDYSTAPQEKQTDNVVYLNLSHDPVVVGGFNDEDIAYYLSIGYELTTLGVDKKFRVQFLNSEGEFYYKDGYIHAGEIMLILPGSNPPSGFFKGCGNVQLELFD
jgi:hypothetical protein